VPRLLHSDDQGLTWTADDSLDGGQGTMWWAVTTTGDVHALAGAVRWDTETPGPGAWVRRGDRAWESVPSALGGAEGLAHIVTIPGRVLFFGSYAAKPFYAYEIRRHR
jgi:hypothetical protein